MLPLSDTPFSSALNLERLTQPGFIGFYDCVEITEIVGFRSRGADPVNVLTVAVAENRDGQALPSDAFLGARIRVPSLRDWAFGVFRYYRPIEAVTAALCGQSQLHTWVLSGKSLNVGRLDAQPPVVVPPDTYLELPWNRVLKNNFWSGSYVLEWHDANKNLVAELLNRPLALQELTAAIKNRVSISLASLSDRVGNILLQLPLTTLVATFAPLREDGGMAVEVAWHPKATPRPIRVEVTRRYDGVAAAVARAAFVGSSTIMPVPDGPGDYEGLIWDDENKLVLAATGPSVFVAVIDVEMQVGDPEPRMFETGPENARVIERVRVHTPRPLRVGEPFTARTGTWTEKRIYRDEVERLAARRAFIQYKPAPGGHEVERRRALGDLRYLISAYGRGGAYLWDPYLSAADLLDTLFYCPTAGADLRGLTAMSVSDDNDDTGGKAGFVARQRATFQAARGNFRGLRLEFRGRVGSRGWDFHDRFLLFPDTKEGPLAWSLSTSVNALGKQHHILQRDGDGRLILDAFLELWDLLDGPEHLIWSRP